MVVTDTCPLIMLSMAGSCNVAISDRMLMLCESLFREEELSQMVILHANGGTPYHSPTLTSARLLLR